MFWLGGGFPVKSYLVGYLTFIPLLCFQAWDPAESPGECPSSPAAPSASPWAGRAPGAGGGDPGLRRWGAGGPRRLLQRSERHTNRRTGVIRPSPLLPLSTSVVQSSTMAALSHTVSSLSASVCISFPLFSLRPGGICSSVVLAISVTRVVVVTPAFQGCLAVARKERQSGFLQGLRMLNAFSLHSFVWKCYTSSVNTEGHLTHHSISVGESSVLNFSGC